MRPSPRTRPGRKSLIEVVREAEVAEAAQEDVEVHVEVAEAEEVEEAFNLSSSVGRA